MRKLMPLADFWKYIGGDIDEIIIYECYDGSRYVEGRSMFSERFCHSIYMNIDGPLNTPIKRPIDPSSMIGKFGKFWDGHEEPTDKVAAWGYVEDIGEWGTSGKPSYLCRNSYWQYFKPCIPSEAIE